MKNISMNNFKGTFPNPTQSLQWLSIDNKCAMSELKCEHNVCKGYHVAIYISTSFLFVAPCGAVREGLSQNGYTTFIYPLIT